MLKIVTPLAAIVCLSIPFVATAAKDNTNFLNGKPFNHLSEQINLNTQAIDGLQAEVAAATALVIEMEARVSSNEAGIADLQAQLSGVNASLSGLSQDLATLGDTVDSLSTDQASLRLELGRLESELQVAVSALQGDIANLTTTVAGLSGQLDGLAAQLATKVAELQAAITANSGDISALSASVSLLSGSLGIAQANITGLLARIAEAEQALEDQQAALSDFNVQLAQAAQMGGGSAPSQTEISIQDAPGNTFYGHELRELMRTLIAEPGDYLYAKSAGTQTIEFCLADASKAISPYAGYTQDYYQDFSSNDSWMRSNEDSWSQRTLRLQVGYPYHNSGYYYAYTQDRFMLETYDGYPYGRLLFVPAYDNFINLNIGFETESYFYSPGIGLQSTTNTLTFRTGSREAACGF